MASLEPAKLSETLAQIFLFTGTSVEKIDAQTPFLHACLPLTFSQGQIIQNARMPIDGLAVLCDGEAAVLSDSSERAVPLRTIRAGGVFGAASLYSSENRYETVVRAVCGCTILLIPAETVRTLLAHHSILAENYIRFLSDRISFLNRKITAFTVDSAEAKLAVYLSQLVRNEAGVASLPVSLSELADTLGIGRASLYRALAKLEDADILVRSGKQIRIPDPDALLSVFRASE